MVWRGLAEAEPSGLLICLVAGRPLCLAQPRPRIFLLDPQCNLPGCTECQVLPGGFVCKTCRDGYAPVNVNKWGLFTACSPLIPVRPTVLGSSFVEVTRCSAEVGTSPPVG